ncbi:MAG: ABC transporter ATP-binding protein [Candidatus Asgardarchaeia archaeon]
MAQSDLIHNLVTHGGVDVVCDRVVKIYKTKYVEVVALRELTMNVDRGEIRAVVGASGSGKTTLLNLIGGIDYPSAGRILVDNKEISKYSPSQLVEYRRRVVGFIFQFFNLIPTLTALENVMLPMILAGNAKQNRRERAMELLKLVGLEGRANHKPDELSGGEQQRVAIAAALANDPPLILADEPTGELDSATSKQIVDLFTRLNKEMHKTFILVTHDLRVAASADHISRIEDGRIVSTITPEELQTTPEILGAKKDEEVVQRLHTKLMKIEENIKELENDFRAGKIDSETFTKRFLELQKAKERTEEEIKRYTLT